MKFKVFVGICLGLIAYGVLYHDLPCWAQVLDPTMWCQMKAETERYSEQLDQYRKAHPHWREGR